MRQRPIVQHRRRDPEAERRAAANRRRLAAYVSDLADSAAEACDFAKPAEVGRALIDAEVLIVKRAQDAPGAAAALGAASHGLADCRPPAALSAASAQVFGGKRWGEER